jgi:hypothetical protein
VLESSTEIYDATLNESSSIYIYIYILVKMLKLCLIYAALQIFIILLDEKFVLYLPSLYFF